MADCGKRLKESADELWTFVKPGITTKEIDDKAEELIRKNGAEPSFTRVPGYHWTTCLPINDQAVHTPPSAKRIVREGDVLTIDIGAYYKTYHTDYAVTAIVGNVKNPVVEKFLKVGKETLDNAISKAKQGAYLGEISKASQEGIEKNGYFILKELTGHGIGHDLHEDPYVPNYLDRPVEKTYKIPSGLVIAVEVIYSMGSEEIAYEGDDGWSIIAKDGSLSACFEKTLAIFDKKMYILT